jgi:choline monooxygenase
MRSNIGFLLAMSPSLTVEPIEHAHALDVRYYTDAHALDAEQRRVFGASWQLAAHGGELTGAGDHVVCEVAGKPVLIVRGADGTLRAFYNVCRHRAGPIALCNGRAAKALHCKYHGWTYTLEGRLRSAPHMEEACDFDIADIHLPHVRVREWEGLVFVSLSAATPDFDQVYGGIVERIAPLRIGDMRFARRFVYEAECNWKVYVDNFLEGYHLPHVHPGLNRVLDFRAYETELEPWYSLQHSPLRDSTEIYGDGHAYYYFVYPNIMLNIMPGRMQTNRIVPLGVNRCRIEFDYYYLPSDDAMARADTDQSFSHEIQVEDLDICAAVQKGLASGSYTAGRLCPRYESGVWHFQNLLRTAYGRDAATRT